MSRTASRKRLWMLLGGLLIVAIVGYFGWRWLKKPDMHAVVTANNRGVAAMEQYHYQDGVHEFEQVVKLAPDWMPGHVNLAIALLNQDKPDMMDRAIKELQFVLSRSPNDPHANYCLGIILKYRGQFQH